MKIFIFLLNLLLISNYSFNQSSHNNIDFEDGDFTGWTIKHGVTCPIPVTFYCYNLTNTGIRDSGQFYNQSHSIIDSAHSDTTLPFMSAICPWNNSKTLRLGEYKGNKSVDEITMLYYVKPEDSLLQTFYSYIAENAAHPVQYQPFTNFSISDSSNGMIDRKYGFTFSVGASIFNSINLKGKNYMYTDWRTFSFNLAPYRGGYIEIKALVGDCMFGGHTAKMYMDFMIIPNTFYHIRDTICIGDSILFDNVYLKDTGRYFKSVAGSGSSPDSVFILDLVVLNKDSINPKLHSKKVFCVNDSLKVSCSVNSYGIDSTIYNWNINGVVMRSNSANLKLPPSIIAKKDTIFCQVEIYSNGCFKTETSDTLILEVKPPIIVSLSYSNDTIFANWANGISPFYLHWKENGVSISNIFPYLKVTRNGVYSLTIKDNISCTGSDSLNYSFVSNIELHKSMIVYPNPATNILNVMFEGIGGEYSLYTIDGKRIVEPIRLKTSLTTIDISSLESGIYFLKVVNDEGNIFVKRIIKQ